MTSGRLVAIEGGDGSGKGTQAELLREYLSISLNLDVLKVSFPRHGVPSADIAGKYLNGDYGRADQVPADLASLAYAVDRFAASSEIRRKLVQKNSFVIADRYVASNLAHQGTKFANKKDRLAFYDRIMELEYGTMGIPKPDKQIVLIVPTAIAQINVDKKEARSYTTKKRDIHEANASHLDRAKANYEELCRLYPDEFTAIQCVDELGAMRSIDDIQLEIRDLIKL